MRKKRPLASPPPPYFLSSSLSFPSLLSRPRNPLSSCLHPPQSLLISPISPPPHPPFSRHLPLFSLSFFFLHPAPSSFPVQTAQATGFFFSPPPLRASLHSFLYPPSSSPPPLDPHSPEIARKGVYVFLSPLFSLCPLFSPPPPPLFSPPHVLPPVSHPPTIMTPAPRLYIPLHSFLFWLPPPYILDRPPQ